MNTAQLILELTRFFFNDLFHFLALIILLMLFKGTFHKIYITIKGFFTNVHNRYKRMTLEKPKPKDIPEPLKKFNNTAEMKF